MLKTRNPWMCRPADVILVIWPSEKDLQHSLDGLVGGFPRITILFDRGQTSLKVWENLSRRCLEHSILSSPDFEPSRVFELLSEYGANCQLRHISALEYRSFPLLLRAVP